MPSTSNNVESNTAANLATVIRAACGSKAQNAEARAQTMIAAAGMAAGMAALAHQQSQSRLRRR